MIAAAVISYVLYGFWWVVYGIFADNNCIFALLLICLFIVCGNVLLLIATIVTMLLMEILCFSLLTIFIYRCLSVDRWDYQDKFISNIIKEIINFVSNANETKNNNDRVIRILCVNYSYLYNFETFYEKIKRDKLEEEQRARLQRWGLRGTKEETAFEVDKQIKKFRDTGLYNLIKNHREIDTLNRVTYKEIRANCYSTEEANIFKLGWNNYLFGFELFKTEVIDGIEKASNSVYFIPYIFKLFAGIFGLIVVYILLPCYVLSRIVTLLYPYFILFYIYYYDIYYKLNPFELTMLAIYIVLQIGIFIFSYFVLRIHLWLWHIVPGKTYSQNEILWGINHDKTEVDRLLTMTYKYYDQVQWLPFASQIVIDIFGPDIGNIIVVYLKAMNWECH